MPIFHEYEDSEAKYELMCDGSFYITTVESGCRIPHQWYKERDTMKPWLVQKRSQFKSLIKMANKDGGFAVEIPK